MTQSSDKVDKQMNQHRLQIAVMIAIAVWTNPVHAQEPLANPSTDTCVKTNVPLGQNLSTINQVADALIQTTEPKCFDPMTDERIQKYFKPNQFGPKADKKCEMFETEDSMKRMHEKILSRCKEYGMDPRLVYLTVMGEAAANPFIQGGQSGTVCPKLDTLKVGPGRTFSMFQFLGGSNAIKVLQAMKENAAEKPSPSRGAREVVFDYYFDQYVKRAKEFFVENEVERMTCLKVKKSAAACRMFSELEPIEQLAKLDLGNVGAIASTRRKLVNGGYKNTKGYELFYEIEGGKVPGLGQFNKVPLCGEQK
jgi:hypothetical protein